MVGEKNPFMMKRNTYEDIAEHVKMNRILRIYFILY